ncbi:hypothetical protein CUR43_14960, partial [Enterococcus faecium]
AARGSGESSVLCGIRGRPAVLFSEDDCTLIRMFQKAKPAFVSSQRTMLIVLAIVARDVDLDAKRVGKQIAHQALVPAARLVRQYLQVRQIQGVRDPALGQRRVFRPGGHEIVLVADRVRPARVHALDTNVAAHDVG